jgi:hypothetical protein
MAKYKYTGTDKRVFPSLAIVVAPDEEFEAPDDFNAYEVISVSAKISTKPVTITPQESE